MSKKRILKILGVALTLSLVFSLAAVFTAIPVAADEDEWSMYDYPEDAADGDYWRDALIVAGPGPIARDIDGYFWAYINAGTADLYVSLDTEGRSWDVTEYQAETSSTTAIVAIVTSTEDEDVVYVADTTNVYKTEDGGDEWDDLGTMVTGTEVITCMAVGSADDEPHVYVGTADPGAGWGEVYHLYDVAFGGAWEDLDMTVGAAATVDVYAIAVSPDFDNDAFAVALATDDANTYVAHNVGAAAGAANWTDMVIQDEIAGAITLLETGAISFPDDFDVDDADEYFVGIAGDLHSGSTNGGVVRVYDLTVNYTILDDVDTDINSVDVVGNVGNTYILAGEFDNPDVWYSDDDGDSWEQASVEGIDPAGVAPTYVIADEDIDDDGIGWAATVAGGADDDSCLSMTMDGGTTWVGISLLNTAIANIDDFAVDASSPEAVFMLTDTGDDVYRYDGTNWERVWESTQYGGTTVEMIAMSPEFGDDETAFMLDTVAASVLWFTEDGGTFWDTAREAPTDIPTGWVVVDAETLIVGDTDGDVWVTDVQGRRAWDEWDCDAGGDDIVSLAVLGDTVIAGNLTGDVFISEDFAETWDAVGNVISANPAYVAFDPDYATNSTIYAAAGAIMARFLDTSELDEDWEEFTADGAAAFTAAASGIAVASDGTVYVSDPGAADVTNDDEGGMQRTVNPLEDVDDVELTEFDIVLGGLDDGVTTADILTITEAGTTTIWIVDSDAFTIWVYEDIMAAPASGGEADPDVDSATLIWDDFDNATDYEVRVYSDLDMGMAYEWHDALTGDDDPILNVTAGNTTNINLDNPLDAGTEYWWQVRAATPVFSRWSDVWTFTTLPATMTIDADQFGPAIGATNVPIMPSFGWQDIEEADEYMFELADNPDFTTPIVSTTTTNPVFQLDAALDYLTNYFWRVKAISGTGQSRWATGTFTTMAEPVEAPTPPPPAEAPTITLPPTQQIAPNYIYAIIGIGAALAVVVIVLIVRTRKP